MTQGRWFVICRTAKGDDVAAAVTAARGHLSATGTTALRRGLRGAAGPPSLVLDLAETGRCSDEELSVLVGVSVSADSAGGQVVWVASAENRALVGSLRLMRFAEVVDTLDQAWELLGVPGLPPETADRAPEAGTLDLTRAQVVDQGAGQAPGAQTAKPHHAGPRWHLPRWARVAESTERD